MDIMIPSKRTKIVATRHIFLGLKYTKMVLQPGKPRTTLGKLTALPNLL